MSRNKHRECRITTTCPYCGASVTEHDEYCDACGRSLTGHGAPACESSDSSERMENGSVSDRLSEGFDMMNDEDGL